MTEALIRTCPKCKVRIIKEDGCNKVVCTTCSSGKRFISTSAICVKLTVSEPSATIVGRISLRNGKLEKLLDTSCILPLLLKYFHKEPSDSDSGYRNANLSALSSHHRSVNRLANAEAGTTTLRAKGNILYLPSPAVSVRSTISQETARTSKFRMLNVRRWESCGARTLVSRRMI